MTDPLRQRAEDLAAYYQIPVEEAASILRQTLMGYQPPLSKFRVLPWYLRPRWVPLLWKQRWLLRQLT